MLYEAVRPECDLAKQTADSQSAALIDVTPAQLEDSWSVDTSSLVTCTHAASSYSPRPAPSLLRVCGVWCCA